MMIYVTDCVNGQAVAVNTNKICLVFKITEGENTGKTCITLDNNNHILVKEEDYEVVATINNGENA